MPLLRRDRRAQAGFEARPGCGAHGRWRGLAAVPVGGGEAWLRCPWAVARPGCGARGRWRGLAGQRVDAQSTHQRSGAAGVEGAGGTGGHGRASRRGLAAAPVGGGGAWPGFEIDHSEPSGSRVAISRAGRRPRAHQAARPHSRIRRRPEHQRSHRHRHKQEHRHDKAGRNLSVPARPQCSVVVGAARQVLALRDR